MPQLNDVTPDELIQFNRQGLIVGDQEDSASFLLRVKLFSSPEKLLEANQLPPKLHAYSHYFSSSELTKRLDLDPSWVYLWCSNKELMPWEAASTWLIKSAHHFHYPVLQFRKSLERKKSYLGYQYSEIFAHEMVHIARSEIEGSQFEEMIAYRTSKNWFRRLLGPFFKNPHEAILYVITWSLCSFSGLLFAMADYYFFFALTLCSFAFASLITLFGVGRLFFKHSILKRAIKALSRIFPQSSIEAILIRLNDEEIRMFASKCDHKAEVERMQGRSLKWKQMLLAYKFL